MYSIVKKIRTVLIAGIIILMEMNLIFAQVIQTESFDSTTFPPAGWDITSGGGPGGSLWVRRTTGTNPTCTTHSGAGMARFTANNVQPGSQEIMTTPPFSLIGTLGAQATFSLWVYRDNSSTAGDSISIFVNTVNSLTNAVRIGGVARSRFFVLPVNEPANGWYQYTFNIPNTFTTDTNYVLLRGTARGGGNIYVDDIEWTEYPTLCSTPVAGGVAAVDSLICGGSGNTDLSLTGSGLSGGGLTFQWQNAIDSIGPWTNFGTSLATINTGTITSSTWYRCYVTCSVGSVTDTSSATYVAVSTAAAPTVVLNVGNTVNHCSQAPPVLVTATGSQFYTWQPSVTTLNAIGDSALVDPAFTTSYTISGFDSIGCSASATVVFNVANSPNVVGTVNNDTICEGANANLNAFIQGPGFGIQYLWQPGALTGAFQSVSPTATTQYIVAATSPQTGCTGYDTVLVVVNPSPGGAFTFSQNNLTFSFTDASTGTPTSWLWNFGDGSTDTVQNPVHTYTTNGTYTVTLTVSNGLCTETITQTITVVSINDLQYLDGMPVMLYPNPALEKSILKFTGKSTPVNVTVSDYLSKVLFVKEFDPSNNNLAIELNLSVYNAGVYFVQVKSNSGEVIFKLIKQ